FEELGETRPEHLGSARRAAAIHLFEAAGLGSARPRDPHRPPPFVPFRSSQLVYRTRPYLSHHYGAVLEREPPHVRTVPRIRQRGREQSAAAPDEVHRPEGSPHVIDP